MQIKWLKFKAEQSKLTFDNDARKIYYDGEEVTNITVPIMAHEDLRIFHGLALEAEMQLALLNELTERFGFTEVERDCARAAMACYMRLKWE